MHFQTFVERPSFHVTVGHLKIFFDTRARFPGNKHVFIFQKINVRNLPGADQSVTVTIKHRGGINRRRQNETIMIREVSV